VWYALIIIGFLGQIMIQGNCIIDEVLLLALIGIDILVSAMLYFGWHSRFTALFKQ
jgi:hypothetical protein